MKKRYITIEQVENDKDSTQFSINMSFGLGLFQVA